MELHAHPQVHVPCLPLQSKRLDAEGAMRHPFFAGVDWAGLEYEVAPEGLQQEAPATGTA